MRYVNKSTKFQSRDNRALATNNRSSGAAPYAVSKRLTERWAFSAFSYGVLKVFRQPPPRWFAFRLFSNVAQRTGFASKSRLLWEQPCAAMGRKAALAISDRNSETSALPQASESPLKRLFAPSSPTPGMPAPMCVVPPHDHCCSG